MTDHSEFPWGPQYEPGLLTPLGIIGWVVASVLLLMLLMGAVGPQARKAGATHLDDIYKLILAAARFALKQDEFGILRGADVLRRVIKMQLGGVLMAGGALGKQMKALSTALGEKDDKDKKKDDKHGKDAHGKGGHGGGHGAGHGAHAAHASHGGHGEAPAAVANTVQGHSITVNVGGDGHGGHEEEHEEEEHPLSLEDQLIALRKAVREFEAWWSDKPSRMAELRAAQDDLTIPKKPDPALIALFEEKK